MQSNGRLPPLSALRAFETTADELSVTPAAISHQIYALEADLGVGLFKRLNRSVELTVSARVLLPGLSEAFPGIQSWYRLNIARHISNRSRAPATRLRLASEALSPLQPSGGARPTEPGPCPARHLRMVLP